MTPDKIEKAVEAQESLYYYARINVIPFGNNEGDVEGGMIAPDHLKRLLELEAAQPRLWTSETIAGAPGGERVEYVLGHPDGWGGAASKENAVRMLGGVYDRAFGPLPVIPAREIPGPEHWEKLNEELSREDEAQPPPEKEPA